METNLLRVADLLAGSQAVQDVTIPAAVLLPAASNGEAHSDQVHGGQVRMRPLSIAVLSLISRAARDDAGLIPLLMIKEAVVDPPLTLDQIRQMHAGLVYFLADQANRLSGLNADGAALEEATNSTLGQTHILLAKHFGWTPEQVSRLTPGQVAVYLSGIEKLLQLEQGRP